MSWNIDDEKFDEKAGAAVFNGGIAGEVIAIGSIEAGDKSANANNPDWKVVFTDQKGASVNMPIWTDEPDTSEEWKVKKAAGVIRNLKHIVKNSIGEAMLQQIPKTQGSYKELVDSLVNLLKNNGFAGHKYIVFTTYGTTGSKKDNANSFIGLRSYPPFIRREGEGETMTAGSLDVMERVTADAVTSGQPAMGTPASNW